MTLNRGTGALLSPPDSRDYQIKDYIPVKSSSRLPSEFILTKPTTKDQMAVGACVAFSLGSHKSIQEFLERGAWIDYSEMFIYTNRNENDYHGEGMYPRQALKQLQKDGVCEKYLLPQVVPYSKKPQLTKEMFENAKYQKIGSYARCNTLDEIKSNVFFNGGVIITVKVTKEFNISSNRKEIPLIKLPKDYSDYSGLHAVLVIGWNKDGLIFLNSWGDYYGYDGLAILPYKYEILEAWATLDINTPPPNITTDEITLHVGQKDYTVNGKKYTMDTEPFIIDGRTFVPLRFVAQACGFGVTWNNDNRTTMILNKNKMLLFNNPDNKSANYYYSNDTLKILHPNEMPILKDNRLFIPLRIVMEEFGRKVEWHQDSQKIIIKR